MQAYKTTFEHRLGVCITGMIPGVRHSGFYICVPLCYFDSGCRNKLHVKTPGVADPGMAALAGPRSGGPPEWRAGTVVYHLFVVSLAVGQWSATNYRLLKRGSLSSCPLKHRIWSDAKFWIFNQKLNYKLYIYNGLPFFWQYHARVYDNIIGLLFNILL